MRGGGGPRGRPGPRLALAVQGVVGGGDLLGDGLAAELRLHGVGLLVPAVLGAEHVVAVYAGQALGVVDEVDVVVPEGRGHLVHHDVYVAAEAAGVGYGTR